MPTRKVPAESTTKKEEKRPPTPEEIAEKRIKLWSRRKPKSGHKIYRSSSILDLSSLGLKDFPESLRRLTNLEGLDLRGNNIARVPSWIRELKTLQRIRLSDNPIKKLPRVPRS